MANPATPPDPDLRDLQTSHEREDQSAPLIVLEERHLEEPVEDVVRRLQADPEHKGARILVIGRDASVLEAGAGPVLRPHEATPSRHRPETPAPSIEDALQRTGERWLQLEQLMDQWIAEHATLIGSLEDSLSTSDLNALATNVRRLWELHRWMQATLDETAYVAGKTADGMEPVASVELLRDAASDLHALRPGLDIKLPQLDKSPRLYARPSDLRTAFLTALLLMAERQQWASGIRIEVHEGDFFVFHRFMGQADSELADVPTHLGERLRNLIVDRHHGLVLPGAGGPTGASLVIALPRRCIEFLNR